MFQRITRSFSRRNQPESPDQPEPSHRRRNRRDRAQTQAPPQPEPQEEPRYDTNRYDSDSDPDLPENQYDPDAEPYEDSYGFRIPTSQMLSHVQRLIQRRILNTRLVDWDTLEELDMIDDFLEITKDIGITKKFWDIDCPTYIYLTIQFLASLKLKIDKNGRNKMTFRLGDKKYRVLIDELRGILGFKYPDLEIPFHRPGWDKSIFWKAITGLDSPMGNKVRFIQSPPLRILHRILASTIFAKGETCTHTTDLELKILDMMLQDRPTKPDFTLLMVYHWLDIRDNPRSGGAITMGSYVTFLGQGLGLNFEELEKCDGPSRINIDYLDRAQFLKKHGPGNYEWLMPNRRNFFFPYVVGLNKRDMTTWIVPEDYLDLPDGEDGNNSPMHADPPHHVQPGQAYAEAQWNPHHFSHSGSPQAGPSTPAPHMPPPYQPYYPPQQWYTDVTTSLGRLTDLTLENQADIRAHRQDTTTRFDNMEHTIEELPRRHRRHRRHPRD